MERKESLSTLDLINSHSSVRHFTGQDVPVEDEKLIVNAARMASSSCNLQPYSIISVRNPDTRRKIAALSEGAAMAEMAPLLLMICVDQHKLDVVARISGVEYYKSNFLDSFIIGVSDTSLAAQNAALAAESLGYGICYIGSIRGKMEELRSMFKLPDKVFPLYGLAIGVPARKNPVKPRIPLEGTWFHEVYDEKAAENAVREYDRSMISSGVYDGRHFTLDYCRIKPGVKKSDQDSYGWIEHSARRISSTNPGDIRPDMRGILEKAGFKFE